VWFYYVLTISLGESGFVTSFEWWAHARAGAGAGHQLHWDLDEGALEAWRGKDKACRGPPPHPEVSAVIYLSEGASIMSIYGKCVHIW